MKPVLNRISSGWLTAILLCLLVPTLPASDVSDAALADLESRYQAARERDDGPALAAIALELAAAFVARAEFATGRARLVELLDTDRSRWSAIDSLRVELALADLINRQMSDAEAMAIYERLAPEVAALAAQQPGLYGEWLLGRGTVHHDRAEHELALADFIEALGQFDRSGDGPRQSLTLIRLGLSAMRAQFPASALDYFHRAEALLAAHPNVDLSLSLYPNLGIIHQELGQIDQAIAAYQQGYELSLEFNRPLVQAQSLLNIGTVHYQAEQREDALAHYRQSLAISEQHDIQYGVLLNRINIGQIHIELERFDEALASLSAAREQAEAAGLKHELREIYQLLTELSVRMGDFVQGLTYQQQFIELSEEIFNQSRDQAIAELRVRFETDLKSERLIQQELELARITQHNRLLNVVVALGLVIIALGIWQYLHRVRTLQLLYARNRDLVDYQFGPSPRMPYGPAPGDDSETGLDQSRNDHQLRELYLRLRTVMTERELFRDPNLTIAKLSAAAGSNRNYVSAALSRYGRGNFSGFVNGFRINEARRVLSGNEPAPPILELIEHCGFSSRSAFYDAFNKEVGMTPSKFKAMALRSRSQSD